MKDMPISQANKHKKRVNKQVILCFAIGFAILGIFIILSLLILEPIVNHYTEKITTDRVLPALEKRFGVLVKYSSLENYFVDRQIVISNVSVQLEGRESFLDIGSLELDYSLTPFSSPKIKINRLTLVEPNLKLVRLQDKTWNITPLFDNLKRIKREKSSIVGHESLLSSLSLPEISIRKGSLSYNDLLVGISQNVFDLSGSFKYDLKTNAMNLSIAGSWPNKKEPFKSQIYLTPDSLCVTTKSPPLPIQAFAHYLPRHISFKPSTSFGGDFTMWYSFLNKDISLKGRLDFVDWGFFHEYIAEDTLSDLTFSINTNTHYIPRVDSLYLGTTELLLGKFLVRMKGDIITDRKNPIVNVKLYINHQRIQDLLDGLPSSLIPRLKGFRVSGELDYAITLNWNAKDVDQINFEPTGNVKDFKILSEPSHTSILKLKDSFYHEVYENEEYIKTIYVSPRSKSFTSINDIPDYLVRAVLACEDGGFFGHKGFSLRHIQRAIKHDVKSGRFVRGASTISMQLAKNLYLNRKKNLRRKFQEALLTFAIENEIPKRRMLEIYLNIIEFGPKIYGITDATRVYFARPPWNISGAEAAWLATIIRSPKTYYNEFLRGELWPNHEDFVNKIEEIVYSGSGNISEPDYSGIEFAPPPRKYQKMRKDKEEEEEEEEEAVDEGIVDVKEVGNSKQDKNIEKKGKKEKEDKPKEPTKKK